jgi:hypothetical protein
VNTVTKIRVPYNAGKFSSSCITGGFSRRASSTKLVSSLVRCRCEGNIKMDLREIRWRCELD